MTIRKFKESDLPAIYDIYAQSKLDELSFEEREFKLLPLEDDTKRLPQFEESEIFVYDKDGIGGYAALYNSEIRALFVHPTSRGKGIGKLLLEFMLSKIKGKANLFVAKTNHPAKKLYEAYGFEVINEFETEYNGVPVYANEMVRAINNG